MNGQYKYAYKICNQLKDFLATANAGLVHVPNQIFLLTAHYIKEFL